MFDRADMHWYRYAFVALIMATFCVATVFLIGVEPRMAGVAALLSACLGVAITFDGILLHKAWSSVAALGIIASTVWQMTLIDLSRFRGFSGDLASNARDAYVIVSCGWLVGSIIAFMFLLASTGEMLRELFARSKKT